MAENRHIRIGDLLKEYGYLDDEQLTRALAYQKANNVRLGAAVIALGLVSENEVLQALSHKLNIPYVNMTNMNVSIEALKKIPRALAEKSIAIPVAFSDGALQVVINDPIDMFAIEELQSAAQMPVSLLIGNTSDIRTAISEHYSEVDARKAVDKADAIYGSMLPEIQEINTVQIGDDTTPVVNLLNSLMLRSYNSGASDLHIEPFEDISKVRMRVDGALINYSDLPKNIHSALIVRLKIMANLDIAEKRLPQDGHYRISASGNDLNVRLSVLPTIYGEKAVLRFLTTNSSIDHQEHFGMIEADYQKFMRILESPNGIIYITGPTGSGKTTTMYMALEHFSNKQINISSIEDPVERNLMGVNQVQVNNMAGLTFQSGLRSLMRQDPDIIMVGETRDAQTASISVSAAITGHLVLSTLHTNDALASIVRLEDMGVPAYLVGNSVVGLVAQRLLRKICPYCAQSYTATDIEILTMREASTSQISLRRGAGCHVCNETGYKGRIAVHEVVAVDKHMQRMIAEGALMSTIYEYARNEQGMATLRDRAKSLLLEGVTSFEEFIKIGETID
ncbi:MAG: Flp pilus assembly complex ATPase component TadA [Coriobacteriales bacterium]|nr:Flp pilus assembly complex ATPase component TadA [Coriobacteriales bacterium]